LPDFSLGYGLPVERPALATRYFVERKFENRAKSKMLSKGSLNHVQNVPGAFHDSIVLLEHDHAVSDPLDQASLAGRARIEPLNQR